MLRALEVDDELRPPVRVLQGKRLDVTLTIAEGCEGPEDALLCSCLLRDDALHGEPRSVRFDVLALEPRHIPILPVYREHDRARRYDVCLVPYPEENRLHVVEDAPDHLEEDKKLVDRLLALFQRPEEKVEHILAEGIKSLHALTPFGRSQRQLRE
ncbi:hypothetical protein SDC9_55377 [bioreactor metagenome]|uniref:Uncharacterized protein n=1 Tax=bioreactor metagenome TaxID=1076179 RepID=A0A644WZN0_9ZZZZ